MIPRYTVFRERLAVEWRDARRAAEKAIRAYRDYQASETRNAFNLEATALNLHGFYNGLERIFGWIARQMDNTIPEGPFWHRDLLAQKSQELPGIRPAVIASTTRIGLGDYLGFRQVVRNTYTWDFEADKIGQLADRLPVVLLALDEDLKRFLQYLEEASHADET